MNKGSSRRVGKKPKAVKKKPRSKRMKPSKLPYVITYLTLP